MHRLLQRGPGPVEHCHVGMADRVEVREERANGHLAVVDLTSKPTRLLYYLPVESLPEGIEFTPDGTHLFVQLTYAHRIAAFDVDGLMLKRSPFVLRVGHGPSSMAIGPRSVK